jgi:hypothetical protein
MVSVTMYMVFIVQAYQTSRYVVPCGGIFLSKWRSSFAGSSLATQIMVVKCLIPLLEVEILAAITKMITCFLGCNVV